MEFRYHPITADIQCNEDGTVILFRGEELRVKGKPNKEYVHILDRRINVTKIVMECWHGMSPSPDHIASRIDPNKGNHYTNLHYIPRVSNILTKSVMSSRDNRKFKSLPERLENEKLENYLIRVGMARSTYFKLKKKYGDQ